MNCVQRLTWEEKPDWSRKIVNAARFVSTNLISASKLVNQHMTLIRKGPRQDKTATTSRLQISGESIRLFLHVSIF